MYKKLFVIISILASLAFAVPGIGNFVFDGVEPVAGETISNMPLITVVVTGNNVSYNAFDLRIDDETVNVLTTNTYQYDIVTNEFRFQVPDPLSKGMHYFWLRATDDDGSTWSCAPAVPPSNPTGAFVASDKFKIVDNPVVYPSPATSNVKITYELTQNNDVDLYIYSTNGEILYHNAIYSGQEGGHAGFNEVSYDLKSGYGNDLPNGVYIVLLAYKDGRTRELLGKTKFFVLRQ